MKYFFATLTVLLLLLAATAAVTYRATGDRGVKAAMAKRDALEWLRAEFGLNEAQYRQIKELHEAYSSVCEEHCRQIQLANRERNELKALPQANPEILAAAETRLSQLRLECETAIAAHVRQCAAMMSPAAGERYLAMVLPKIADFDHRAAPDVQLSAHEH
jgi:hypothetical protein